MFNTNNIGTVKDVSRILLFWNAQCIVVEPYLKIWNSTLCLLNLINWNCIYLYRVYECAIYLKMLFIFVFIFCSFSFLYCFCIRQIKDFHSDWQRTERKKQFRRKLYTRQICKLKSDWRQGVSVNPSWQRVTCRVRDAETQEWAECRNENTEVEMSLLFRPATSTQILYRNYSNTVSALFLFL